MDVCISIHVLNILHIFNTVIPSIIEAPASILVAVHAQVNFTCIAGAKPRCAIYWIKKGRLLSNNSLSDGGVPVIITSSTIGSCAIADPPDQCVTASTLQIFNVTLSDGGGYTCVSTNKFGAENYTAFLFVNGNCLCNINVFGIDYAIYQIIIFYILSLNFLLCN